MHLIMARLGGKSYQRQQDQSGIQPQSSVIPRKIGGSEGGTGLGLCHCVILWATPGWHMEREQDAHVSCHDLCLSRAKE